MRSSAFLNLILVSALALAACTKKAQEVSPTTGGGSDGGSTSKVFTNGQAADYVIGQTGFASSAQSYNTADGLNNPGGVSLSSAGIVYVSDTDNHRVLGYNSIPTSNGVAANFVIGQPNFTNTTFGATSATEMISPGMTSVSGSQLFVADSGSNRIAIYNSTTTTNASVAYAIGQTNLTGGSAGGTSATTLDTPFAVASAAGKIVLADSQHNRVLLYNSIPTSSGASADVVLGQTSMGASTSTGTGNFSVPQSVWTNGTKVVIGDNFHGRVLIWNTWPTTYGQAPDVILGQTSISGLSNNAGGVSASSINTPASLASNGTTLVMGDFSNNRVLVWKTWPTTNNQAADLVLGQPDFLTITAGSIGASTLSAPNGVAISADGSTILVSEGTRHRVLVFNKH